MKLHRRPRKAAIDMKWYYESCVEQYGRDELEKCLKFLHRGNLITQMTSVMPRVQKKKGLASGKISDGEAKSPSVES